MLYVLLVIFLIYFIPYKKIKFSIVKLKNCIIPLCVIALLILLVIFSEDAFNSAYKGIILWSNNVVPSLFPFLICVEILKKTNVIHIIGKILEPIIRPIFNIPGSGSFAVVMGMCSGYPVGAKIAASLREENQCTITEGERLLAFTNTSGPLFILGAVGIGMFADNKIGFLLLITHFIAALLVGILFRFYKYTPSQKKADNKYMENTVKNKSSKAIKLSDFGMIMGDAIRNSISTLLLICGFIVFFCVLGAILDNSGVTKIMSNFISTSFIAFGFPQEFVSELSIGCFKGILEITSGLKLLSGISMEYNTLLPFIAFILGFGGISVHMQVASIVSNTDLSIKPYLIGKMLHGTFAGIITYFILNYTNFFNLEAVETFSSFTFNNISSLAGSGNILIIALGVLIIISLIRLLFKKSTYSN